MKTTSIHDLSLIRDEMPDGPVGEDSPARSARNRFGVAVPMLAVMFANTAIIGGFLVAAGAAGWMNDPAVAWTPGLLIGAMLALLAGQGAAQATWRPNERVGPWRPLFAGLGTSVLVLAGTFYAIWLTMDVLTVG